MEWRPGLGFGLTSISDDRAESYGESSPDEFFLDGEDAFKRTVALPTTGGGLRRHVLWISADYASGSSSHRRSSQLWLAYGRRPSRSSNVVEARLALKPYRALSAH